MLELSDGVHSLQVILSRAFSHLVNVAALRRGTVLRLLGYMCSTIRGRRFIIVVNFEILQIASTLTGSPRPYECGQGVVGSCSTSRSGEGASMPEPFVRKTVAQISDDHLECSDKTDTIVVSATLSSINTLNFCYTACPVVVNGRQCNMKVTRNGDGLWYCDICKWSFGGCDYRYSILVKIQDHTGTAHAVAYEEVGQELLGRTGKELYSVKYAERDHGQFGNIMRGVMFHQYLFKLKVARGMLNGEQLVKCTIVSAEKVDTSTENHCLLRVTNKLLQDGSG